MPTTATEKKTVINGLMELFRNNRRWLLFFGTGTSCALDGDFGMAALAEYLRERLSGEPDWASVEQELKANASLEQALETISGQISRETESLFRKEIGDFVAEVDRRHRNKVLLGKDTWIGSSLLKALADPLPRLNPRLSVVTSNYDMLIEYACSALGLRWTTGFARGLVRSWDWEAAQDRLIKRQVDRTGSRSKQYYVPQPRVELFKVHGSINRFKQDGREIECDLWAKEPPDGIDRDIAVPGTLKHKHSSNDTTDMRGYVSRAERDAQAFLMAGYGFGDEHLHVPILERVRREKCPLVVLTLDLSDETITELRKDAAPVWILLAGRSAVGKFDEARTTAYIPERSEPITLDTALWKCDAFAKKIMGG